ALGYQACLKGYKVLYSNTSRLMGTLKAAKAKFILFSSIGLFFSETYKTHARIYLKCHFPIQDMYISYYQLNSIFGGTKLKKQVYRMC
ncbi:hypothetical protein M2101_002095, partial [Parabacteroides sp. PM5-20]|nr:hypothetical protein [Parabacteroides sp. PM5-20]